MPKLPCRRLLSAAWVMLLYLGFSALTAQAQEAKPIFFRGHLAIDGKSLDTGGKPGAYDFEFRAFDHPEVGQGQQVGATVSRPGLPLSNGVFETELDFQIADLANKQLWVETTVIEGNDTDRRVAARLRQILDNTPRPARASQPQNSQLQNSQAQNSQTQTPRPVTSDSEILERLSAVRVVISDREKPGSAHFLVDEDSFRRAYGLGSPVTPLDVASLGIVAASELRREALRNQQRVQELRLEIGQLRFRANLTLLLLAIVVVTVFAQRRREVEPSSRSDKAEQAQDDPPEPKLEPAEDS